MEEKSGIGYFLLGLGIGVAAGILWAPKSGEETRQLIADKAGESADYLKQRTEEGKQYVAQRASESKEYLKQQTETLKGTASDLLEQGKTSVAKQKENLSAAVEAGKQAYRDAVSDVKTATATASNATSGTTPENA